MKWNQTFMKIRVIILKKMKKMFPPSPTIRVGFVAVLIEELLTDSGWLQMALGFRWRSIPG